MGKALSKLFWFLGIALVLFLIGEYFIVSLPLWEQEFLSSLSSQESLTEIASSYYGSLSRPLIPESSLGLPFQVQAIISVMLTLLMVGIYQFLPRARRLVILVTTLTVVRHLVWRAVETLDLSSPMSTSIGLVIYGAELLAFFAMVLGNFQIWGQAERTPIPLSQFPSNTLPSVDVLVCTYNEPVSVLYRTMVGCQSMEYPNKKVYLLDDGNRPEMAQLAQQLGVYYISRPENTHAKAGNLNNALTQTQGDLVLVFDADHVPCKKFLQEVVGFFVDERLAFVQTPQHFFTQDPFQRNLISGEVTNNEQDLFFHVIQPGNDYWGATFFAGSGAIFRRQALETVGGFAVETITEDVHTGLRLHAKGWKSLFYNRDLAAGFAQDSFADFIKQRLRWARGMTQVLYFDHPLLVKGLKWPQRLCYFAGIWYFFHGFPRLVFLIAPLFFLLFGIKTLNAGFLEVLVYYAPSFISLFLGYSIITRGVRQSFWSEVYETALCVYIMLTTFFTMLSPHRAKFRVTPKGTMTDRINFNWQIVFPQLVIASLLVVGIGMAIVRVTYTPEYAGGIYTNLFWSLYNLILLIGAVYVAQERPQLRLSPRIEKAIRCELRLLDGSVAVGYTTNVSEGGLALVFKQPIPISGTMSLKVLDWDINESSVFSVQAVRSTVDNKNQHHVGFQVVNRSEEQHQKLIRHMFGSADVWADDHLQTETGKSFFNLLWTPLRLGKMVEKATRRRAVRFQAALSCLVMVGDQTLMGLSEEVSESGIALYLKEWQSLNLGQEVPVQVQWADGKVSGFTAQVVRMEAAGKTQCRVALNFTNLNRDQRIELIHQVYQPLDNLVRVAPSTQKLVPCALFRPNGSSVVGHTLEVSELGVSLLTDAPISFEPDEKVSIQLTWEDGTSTSYQATYAGELPPAGRGRQANALPLLFYFKNLTLADLDVLNHKLYQPQEAVMFNTQMG